MLNHVSNCSIPHLGLACYYLMRSMVSGFQNKGTIRNQEIIWLKLCIIHHIDQTGKVQIPPKTNISEIIKFVIVVTENI